MNNGNVWTSLEGVYVSFDANTGRLYFNDGSFWVMGSVSASGEQDAGTYYPMLIEDSNGNQINISYAVGAGSSSANTSAGITQIQDARYAPGYYYSFSYNGDQPVPHLTAISSNGLVLLCYKPFVSVQIPPAVS